MKKINVAVLAVLLFSTIAMAQSTRMRKVGAPEQTPLIIVDSVESDFDYFLVIPDHIESVDILSDSATRASYGDRAKYGVIVIRTKKNVEVMRLNDLLNYYNIPKEDRELRVCIDNLIVKDKQKVLASKSEIATVEVVKGICWITPEKAGPDERHINIVTIRGRKKAAN